MDIVSWNVNSVGARLPLLLNWLQAHQPTVVCLQETKVPDERFPYAVFQELGYMVVTSGQKSYNGVAILSKEPLTGVHGGLPYDELLGHRRLIGATVRGIQILNVYIPNGGDVNSDKFQYKLGWLAALREFLAGYDPQLPLLLCGDFNICPEALDVYDVAAMMNQVGFHPVEREALALIQAWGLVDTFRLLNPTVQQFSWWDYRQGSFRRNRGLRIDHIWTTPSLAKRCLKAWIDPEPRQLARPSDHTPVVARFSD
ncbi:exodeoxyribonuclease III [Candidatus Cyanaurora vandensis]|uniref:exodeoxyribonuclease III n=1 Tax=Candidatus Cyanaurora vandensis TaxID=2714958 RepID=UPI00257EFC9A|nr:exodeoxyribonuclease III [Candidatus Cyanaurora vandensis]